MRFLRQCFKEFHQTATSPSRSSWYAICSARVAFELVQHRCRITLVFPSGQNDIMPIFRVQGSGSRIDCKKSHLYGWTSLRRDDSTSIQERNCRTLVDCLALSDQKNWDEYTSKQASPGRDRSKNSCYLSRSDAEFERQS